MAEAGMTLQRLDRGAFAIRPLTVQDRAAVEAIAAQIWEGNDYLPVVFDCWLADDDGLFCAGVLHDQVVAVARLAKIGDRQWWLEGLRVDPACQGLGIGRIMHHYMVNVCRRDHAPGTLSFSTNAQNWAMHKLAAETGFDQKAEFAAYGAAPLASADQGRLVLLGSGDVDAAWACLETLPYVRAGNFVFEDNWHFWTLTRDLLAQRLAAGQVYGWQDRAGHAVAGLVILNQPRDPKADDARRLYAGVIDAVNRNELRELLLAVRGLAGAEDAAGVSWKPLNTPALLAVLVDAGYEQRWDTCVRLYERDLNLLTDRVE